MRSGAGNTGSDEGEVKTDAANRHMKSHGRDHWNEADYNYAVSEYNRLLPGEMKFDIPAIQKIRG